VRQEQNESTGEVCGFGQFGSRKCVILSHVKTPMLKLHLIPLNQDANGNYTQARCSGSGSVCEGPFEAENPFLPSPEAIKTNLQAQFENHAKEAHPGEAFSS